MYTISYSFSGQDFEEDLTANEDGEIIISDLGSGIYTEFTIFDNITGCTLFMEDIVLDSEGFAPPSVESLNPSSCGSEDGSIHLSGLDSNTGYTISFNLNGEEIEVNTTSDMNGEITISGLMAGAYSNILLQENDSGCNLNLQDIILESAVLEEVPPLPNMVTCDEGDGYASFDLSQNEDILPLEDVQISYFLTLEDAENNVNEIVEPHNYQIENVSQMIYVRYEKDGCHGITYFNLEQENCSLFIPQGFSPNGDGFNDTFEISGLYSNFPDFELTIFSRYGNQVYIGNNEVPEWSGISNTGKDSSEPLPSGTYYYHLNLNAPGKKVITGWVYLNR